MNIKDGSNYAPKGKPNSVCKENEFTFSAIALDHGHIYGMCNGLIEAGATLKSVYDPDQKKLEAFKNAFPNVKIARCKEEILQDNDVKLIAGAAITSERFSLGLEVMKHSKDYFTDKAPLTTLSQLDLAKKSVEKTSKKYMVYYSERLHVESAVYAGELIKAGEIGKVVQVLGLGPHRLNAKSRPDWFFKREKFGGILCDLGSHQIEQYLYYADEKDAKVTRSQVANYNNLMYPEFEDFGDAMLVGENKSTNYFRVDWFTPDALNTWGDGRTIILGTKGYIEIRKYIDVARENSGDHVILVNNDTMQHINVSGKVGYPFFGQLILDCLNRTENAMTQSHAFKAAELCIKAQNMAEKISG